MAAKKAAGTGGAYAKVKVRRKGVHAKSKTSKLKTSKNYVKPYKSQG
jgi:hypothetical protein|tara:strand:+ start:390 stop:530 length:141 start_codon:yes stop_codon:yes gene_type:complete